MVQTVAKIPNARKVRVCMLVSARSRAVAADACRADQLLPSIGDSHNMSISGGLFALSVILGLLARFLRAILHLGAAPRFLTVDKNLE